ncbi:DUF4249 domain-containing protein [Sphingobacterium lumbrici]|uniref:DUF4249 domain-containing protein n=1 Tax=Sphingobacterium lumbrici TaxID=2559600 RepID=UPI0011299021|nr:DUF4249 domain-containing protein [Sphingobacterium lumbrici]
MRRCIYLLISVFIAVIMVACEEIIDVNLKVGDPKYVIDADLTSLSSEQVIRVTQTVPFNADIPSKPIENALVTVSDSRGRVFNFAYQGQGYYTVQNLALRKNITYNLSVNIDNELFEATSKLEDLVAIDSLGVIQETIFNEPYYFVLFKFNDPMDHPNYYRYSISVNGGPFRFSSAFSDKFNDGLLVTHQIANSDNSLAIGDSVVVRRQCISKEVYDYWNEIQFANPGNASPSNPKSNISNGAFGYFSTTATKEYGVRIQLL